MVGPQQRRAARHAIIETPTVRKASITTERIIDVALEIVASHGFDALTMRDVAARLNTGPASLYAHVVNKTDLDELLIGRLCSRVELPTPSPECWREQITDVCTQLRDQYLSYPGISRAALAMDVTDLDVLRIDEGMLAILIAGGVDPQTAAWTTDALFMYVGAYTMDIAAADARAVDPEGHRLSIRHRTDLIARFESLPEDRFPHIRAHASELTSGSAHERFDFALRRLLGTPDSSMLRERYRTS